MSNLCLFPTNEAPCFNLVVWERWKVIKAEIRGWVVVRCISNIKREETYCTCKDSTTDKSSKLPSPKGEEAYCACKDRTTDKSSKYSDQNTDDKKFTYMEFHPLTRLTYYAKLQQLRFTTSQQ